MDFYLKPHDYDRFISKWGGKFDYWITHHKLIEKFIKENNLVPIPREVLRANNDYQRFENIDEVLKEKIILWPYPPFPGGLKCAHLHFRDEIYQLRDDQWSHFSRMVIKGMMEKLEKANHVAYKQLLELTEAVEEF